MLSVKQLAPKLGVIDKFLLAGAILGMFIAIIMGGTLLRKDLLRHRMYMFGDDQEDRMHYLRQLGHRPLDFEETDCDIDDVEESDKDVDCTKNANGEWCALEDKEELSEKLKKAVEHPVPPIRRTRREAHRDKTMHHESRGPRGSGHHEPEPRQDSHEAEPRRGSHAAESRQESHEQTEEHHDEPKRRGRHHRFRCMKMKISYRRRQEEERRRAQAYENTTTMNNFPGCSFSRCGENEEVNREQLSHLRNEWLAHKTANVPAKCFVNKHNPDQVVIMAHDFHARNFLRSRGFHAAFWPFVFSAICALIFVSRRCCCRSATTSPNPQKVTPQPGDPYVVASTPRPSDKEIEAFGLSQGIEITGIAPISPNAPSKNDFLLLVPPAYSEVMMQKPIPAFMATIGDQKQFPVEKSVPMVD